METKRHGLIFFTTSINSTRGDLTFIELPKDVGFDVKRVFYVYGNQAGVVRGQHSHRKCKQVLVALRGEVTVRTLERDYLLDEPNKGLFVNTGVYIEIAFNDPDSVFLVLASEHYDPEDYINEYKVP